MAKKKRHFNQNGVKRSQTEAAEIAQLEKAISEGAPGRGTSRSAAQPTPAPGKAVALAPGLLAAARKFEELPLSSYTREGLKESKYVTMTAIQRAALPHGLAGRDILGAAKTGSGKTLAFLIPMLEKLYRQRWGPLDGLGALIISPTRELAMQIFDELRKVGKRHEFSAGLLIGGKNVKEERDRVNGMNILICTPGRLLQHMDETPGFDAGQLQVLVLDEADRILDLGFSGTLNAIVANIPKERQTMLFSATQTKKVKDLARLSLSDPEYIAVHAEAAHPTPLKLQQAYMVCELHEKLDILWSFIKTHLRAKVIVFLSTCKQVKFVHEALRKLRPGVPLRALHGKMKQMKRMATFYEFCEAKAMVLFATDVAARGLDFPTIDWVLQLDCPEDTAAYIHRVGRTARFVNVGRALLLLLPSEAGGMLAALEAAQVPLKQSRHNPAKIQAIGPALQALLSKEQELKETAQRALVSYLRSVFLQPNSAIFDVSKLPVAEYAASLGLPSMPQLRFLKKAATKRAKQETHGAAGDSAKQAAASPEEDAARLSQRRAAANGLQKEEGVVGRPDAAGGAAVLGSKAEKVQKTRDADAHGSQQQLEKREPLGSAPPEEEASDDDDDLLVVKRRNVFEEADGPQGTAAPSPALPPDIDPGADKAKKKKKKKLRIDPNKVSGSKVLFDEDGEAAEELPVLVRDGAGGAAGDAAADGGDHETAEERFEALRAEMRERDVEDRAALKERKWQERAAKRAKRRAAAGEGGPIAMLEPHDEADYSSDDSEAGASGRASSDEEEAASSSEEGLEEEQDILPAGGRRSGARQDATYLDEEWARGGGSEGDSDLEAGSEEDDEMADVDLLSSSDEEGDDEADGRAGQRQQGRQRGAKKREGPPEGVGIDMRRQVPGAGRKRRRGGGEFEGMSLAEQEALALRMLTGKL